MILIMIGPKNETEELPLSITKNCETLIEQIHRKAEETLEFKHTKPRETFPFKPPIQIKGDWMIGLTSLEVYNSILNNLKNNKVEFKTDIFDEFSFAELKYGVDEIPNFSNITDKHLRDEIIGPRIISTYKKLETVKRLTDGNYML